MLTGATPGAIPLPRKADALPFWRSDRRPGNRGIRFPQLLCFTFFTEIEFSVGTVTPKEAMVTISVFADPKNKPDQLAEVSEHADRIYARTRRGAAMATAPQSSAGSRRGSDLVPQGLCL